MDFDDDFATPLPEERLIRPHTLNVEQERDLIEAFSLFDTAYAGVIPMKRLKDILRAVAQMPPEHELQDYYAEYDPDGLDELYLSDFLHIMSMRYKDQTPEDEIIQAFRVFDKDDNGWISEKEFRNIMATLGDPMNDDDLDQIVLDANSNAEGNIVYKDFVAIMTER
ncbi:calmodulin-beta [Drosophila grimshawi]|uniref:GH23399 n=1 Tax=Drosophila grimshawi TaxID=7222 RepID=B4JT32_DROGR|nr:calmodulin-beta [Drosophila grimshawi]EDV94922.1 GH23399 [Drosophila grimshawi]